MKFNKHLPKWRQEFLENEYKQYCKATTMTASERRALREWVKDGNSVYENASGEYILSTFLTKKCRSNKLSIP